MNCFEILEIEATPDTKEIKKAYAKLLKKYHPEDDPEGFKKIHCAYEEALDYAKKGIDFKEFHFTNNDYEQDVELREQKNKFENIHIEIHDDFEVKSDKYGAIDEIENFYKRKIENINGLLNMFIWQKDEYGSPQLSLFETPLFKQCSFEKEFVKRYIYLIEGGLYNNIYISEKRKLRRIHNNLYFKDSQNKHFYKGLYKALYTYLYEWRGGFIEIFLLFIAMAIASIELTEIMDFTAYGVVVLIIYGVSCKVFERDFRRKMLKILRYVIYIYIVILGMINLIGSFL